MFTSQNRIDFGIGLGLDKDSQPILNVEAKLESILKDTAEIFGGYSMSRVNGGWHSPTNGLVTECAVTITVYTELCGNSSEVREFAGRVKQVLNQEAILVAVTPVRVEFV